MQAATFSESVVPITTYMSTRCHPEDNKSHTSRTLALEEGSCSALCSRGLYPGKQTSTLIWQEGPKCRLGVVAKKYALQQPEFISKKTIPGLFT